MNSIVRLLRPEQWIKNFFLFIPVFFGGEFDQIEKLKTVALGFLIFCATSSCVYVLNDLLDVKNDRAHPTKKNRPIASGKVSTQLGVILFGILLVTSVGAASILSLQFTYFVVGYLTLNIAYSAGLKNIPILDIFLVAIGFIIRVLSGGFLVDVPVSHWTIIMVLLLSLFLVMGKRLYDLVLAEEQNVAPRKSSSTYSVNFVNASLTMLSAVMVVSYLMYTVSEDVTSRFQTEYLYLTSIFVIAGVLRYLQIALVEKGSGSPTDVLYRDRFIILTVIGWILAFVLIIYI